MITVNPNGICRCKQSSHQREPLRSALFRKEKKAGKHHSAAAEVCLELDQPGSEENPILLHLLKTCSTYSKIQRNLAYVSRFIHNARKMNPKSGPISDQELKAAETHFLKWSQFNINEDSLDKKLVGKKDEDGLFRAHGRLEDVRCLPEELRKPIILPKDHPFVILLLRDLHKRRGHCGYLTIRPVAREGYESIAHEAEGRMGY